MVQSKGAPSLTKKGVSPPKEVVAQIIRATRGGLL